MQQVLIKISNLLEIIINFTLLGSNYLKKPHIKSDEGLCFAHEAEERPIFESIEFEWQKLIEGGQKIQLSKCCKTCLQTTCINKACETFILLPLPPPSMFTYDD